MADSGKDPEVGLYLGVGTNQTGVQQARSIVAAPEHPINRIQGATTVKAHVHDEKSLPLQAIPRSRFRERALWRRSVNGGTLPRRAADSSERSPGVLVTIVCRR